MSFVTRILDKVWKKAPSVPVAIDMSFSPEEISTALTASVQHFGINVATPDQELRETLVYSCMEKHLDPKKIVGMADELFNYIKNGKEA